MKNQHTVKINDNVRYIGCVCHPHVTKENVGSVIRVYDDLRTEYGERETHLVAFDFGGDLEDELFWFAPEDLAVVSE